MTDTTTEQESESANPAFDRLTRIYRGLGLDPEQASDAAAADLACGWHTGDFRG